MIEYKILREYSPKELESSVVIYLINGYVPHGYLIVDDCSSSTVYMQVMVKMKCINK